jgi:hypothetical protein
MLLAFVVFHVFQKEIKLYRMCFWVSCDRLPQYFLWLSACMQSADKIAVNLG